MTKNLLCLAIYSCGGEKGDTRIDKEMLHAVILDYITVKLFLISVWKIVQNAYDIESNNLLIMLNSVHSDMDLQ